MEASPLPHIVAECQRTGFLRHPFLRPTKSPSSRGFTLVEVMIVVAIIALLASMAVPNYLRARKRSQATRIINDLRLLDGAIEQYSLERSKPGGTTLAFVDLKAYLKVGTVLYGTGQDLYGNSYGPFVVDSLPKVNASTFASLSDIAPAAFWSPYN